MKLFRLLQIVSHYQNSLISHRKLSLDLEIVPFNITGVDNSPWLHYDIEKNCVFCFYCIKNVSKLAAEKNKQPTYTSVGFKNWKKAPKFFNPLMAGGNKALKG